jgi:hypothetical protein
MHGTDVFAGTGGRTVGLQEQACKLNRGVEQGVPDPHVPERPAASETVEELKARQGWVGISAT